MQGNPVNRHFTAIYVLPTRSLPAMIPPSDSGVAADLNASPQVAQRSQGTSLHSFLASLTVSASALGAEVVLFILLKDRLTQLYQPRTYLIPENQRAESSPRGLVSWIPAIFQTSDRVILQKSGLDAFFFLRYLRTLLKIFVPLSLIVIPVLVPLNLVYGKNVSGGVQGLDRLSWANVGLAHTSFYWAHLSMALAVIIYVCHTIYAELIEYVSIRQAYLKSPHHRLQAFANAILVTDIPQRFLTVPTLNRLYGVFPGGVRTIWINRDLSELSKKVRERRRIVCTLEAAETKLIRLAMKSSSGRIGHGLTKTETGGSAYVRSGEPLWKRYVSEKDRDYTRLPILNLTWMPSIPFVGRRVDTIDHCWQEVARLNNEIDQDQREPEKYPLVTSAFIQFNTQEATYMACQSLVRCAPLCFRSQYLEASPVDVKWENLSKKWWARYARTALVVASASALILAWSIPVALTGAISQIAYLTALLPWLRWIDALPAWLLGSLQGVLPQVMLTVLTMLLPYVLRIITERQGLLTEVAVELALQKSYFSFLFIQVFLTVSLSSSITAVIQQLLHGLDSVPAVLASNLPKASNYFFSYLLLRCFSVSASSLLQVGRLIDWCTLARIKNVTPREKWEKQTNLPQMQWGTLFPIYTNLACIGLIYSVIAPLILFFSSITFGLLWVVFRYNLLYVTVSRPNTRGLLYPTALNQLFTGVYVMELCVTGLFFLVRDEYNRATCVSQAVIMIIATAMTLGFQFLLNDAVAPLLRFMPQTEMGEEESEAKDHGTGGTIHLRILARQYFKRLTPTVNPNSVDGIFANMYHDVKDSTVNNHDGPASLAFQHESLCIQKPVVWIPDDRLGISDDEISSIKQQHSNVRISNGNACLDEKGRVIITSDPSELESMKL